MSGHLSVPQGYPGVRGSTAVADPGAGSGGPGPPPLFLDQTEMRAEHFFFFFGARLPAPLIGRSESATELYNVFCTN